MSLRILGAGGHAKVAMEAWRSTTGTVVAVYDDDPALLNCLILGVRVLGPISAAIDHQDALHIAIGSNDARQRIAARVDDSRCPVVAHTGSQVSASARAAAGSLICAGVVVQADAKIGRYTIVNTLALVEHDVVVGDFSHIGPGVRLGGGVRIGQGVLVGIGAIVMPGLTVGDGAIVGSGAVVIGDVPAYDVVVGNPARFIARNQWHEG